MPKTIHGKPVNEHKWKKAKALAAEEGRAEDYAYIMGIYKKMTKSITLAIIRTVSELSKGKKYPVGTIRDWKGKKFQKQGDGSWKEAKKGKRAAGAGGGGDDGDGGKKSGEFAGVKVYDAGNEVADRYTVVIGNDFYGMSDSPNSHQGFNQYVGSKADGYKAGSHLGKKLSSVPDAIKSAVRDRMKKDDEGARQEKKAKAGGFDKAPLISADWKDMDDLIITAKKAFAKMGVSMTRDPQAAKFETDGFILKDQKTGKTTTVWGEDALEMEDEIKKNSRKLGITVKDHPMSEGSDFIALSLFRKEEKESEMKKSITMPETLLKSITRQEEFLRLNRSQMLPIGTVKDDGNTFWEKTGISTWEPVEKAVIESTDVEPLNKALGAAPQLAVFDNQGEDSYNRFTIVLNGRVYTTDGRYNNDGKNPPDMRLRGKLVKVTEDGLLVYSNEQHMYPIGVRMEEIPGNVIAAIQAFVAGSDTGANQPAVAKEVAR